MAKSLQEIEDYYLSQGLRGESLRQALDKDQEFQTLLSEHKRQVRDRLGVSQEEETNYLLPKQEDYEILSKVKQLEVKKLNEHDREVVEVIKAQLEVDWRKPLLDKLNSLLERYK